MGGYKDICVNRFPPPPIPNPGAKTFPCQGGKQITKNGLLMIFHNIISKLQNETPMNHSKTKQMGNGWKNIGPCFPPLRLPQFGKSSLPLGRCLNTKHMFDDVV